MGELKGIEVSNILGFEEPLSKLIDAIRCGIGKVYEPTHIKRMAKAKAKEIELIGEAVTSNLNLPTKYDGGQILIDTSSAEELIKRTGNRVLYREIRRQQNIDAVVADTYKRLENEEKVSAEPVNEDWLFKFFDFAGDISNEQMQQLWSKILAGEIKQPNTYSLKLLNTLKNMTTYEANLFQKISAFSIYHDEIPVISTEIELLKKYGCECDELLTIEDCGLINLNGFTTLKAEKEEKNTLHTEKIAMTVEGYLDIGVYTFSESGKQLLKLIKENTNLEYTIEVMKIWKKQNNSIKAYKIVNFDENNLEYDDKVDLLLENN
ncbi:MAG: DUF2806 domain-containing protein [Clostridia bacterium]|nr:DUF2806 domain-containing protein [Clostridia bacterium]